MGVVVQRPNLYPESEGESKSVKQAEKEDIDVSVFADMLSSAEDETYSDTEMSNYDDDTNNYTLIYNDDGTYEIEQEVLTDGNVDASYNYSSFEFDDDGNLTSYKVAIDEDNDGNTDYTKDVTITYEDSSTTTTSKTYDENGKMVFQKEEVDEDGDGTVDSTKEWSEFNYDNDGNAISYIYTEDSDNDGTVDYKSTVTRTYDEGKKTSEKYETDEDNDGNVDEEVTYDADGNVTATTTYTYLDDGGFLAYTETASASDETGGFSSDDRVLTDEDTGECYVVAEKWSSDSSNNGSLYNIIRNSYDFEALGVDYDDVKDELLAAIAEANGIDNVDLIYTDQKIILPDAYEVLGLEEPTSATETEGSYTYTAADGTVYENVSYDEETGIVTDKDGKEINVDTDEESVESEGTGELEGTGESEGTDESEGTTGDDSSDGSSETSNDSTISTEDLSDKAMEYIDGLDSLAKDIADLIENGTCDEEYCKEYLTGELKEILMADDISVEEKIQILQYANCSYENLPIADCLSESVVADGLQEGIIYILASCDNIEDAINFASTYEDITGTDLSTYIKNSELEGYDGLYNQNSTLGTDYSDKLIKLYSYAESPDDITTLDNTFKTKSTIQYLCRDSVETRKLEKYFSYINQPSTRTDVYKNGIINNYSDYLTGSKDEQLSGILEAVNNEDMTIEDAKILLESVFDDTDKLTKFFRKLSASEQATYISTLVDILEYTEREEEEN